MFRTDKEMPDKDNSREEPRMVVGGKDKEDKENLGEERQDRYKDTDKKQGTMGGMVQAQYRDRIWLYPRKRFRCALDPRVGVDEGRGSKAGS